MDAHLRDALAISGQWRGALDLPRLTRDRLTSSGLWGTSLDVVAIGKASREMAAAVHAATDGQVARTFIVADADSASPSAGDVEVEVGEHPRPGEGSRRAGQGLVDFLDAGGDAEATLFLLSGGASSLCVVPAAPMTVADLGALFDVALAAGVDITTLNRLRAATSVIAGGAVLRHVRAPRSASFILVDNVLSGPSWVASGLTYEYRPSEIEVSGLIETVGLSDTALGGRLREAAAHRREVIITSSSRPHDNLVLAEPSMMLAPIVTEATRRGYGVLDMGATVHGDVRDVRREWRAALRRALDAGNERVVAVGVGEVTVEVLGAGRGGRCQEFAWAMAPVLAELGRPSVFVALATDGRDYIDGVAGGWVDDATTSRLARHGLDWDEVAAANDTYPALGALGQLIEGGHTGWNLCDVYLGLIGT